MKVSYEKVLLSNTCFHHIKKEGIANQKNRKVFVFNIFYFYPLSQFPET